MKKLNKYLVALMIIALPVVANAQYKFAIGLRAGGTSGLTFKYNTTDYAAFEGIHGFWNDGLSITGLYERHPAMRKLPGMHWYYGVGRHVAFYDNSYRGHGGPAWFDEDRDDFDDGAIGIGIDGIVGLEYKIPPIPIAISMDLKPFLEINTAGGTFLSIDPGLGIKVAL